MGIGKNIPKIGYCRRWTIALPLQYDFGVLKKNNDMKVMRLGRVLTFLIVSIAVLLQYSGHLIYA